MSHAIIEARPDESIFARLPHSASAAWSWICSDARLPSQRTKHLRDVTPKPTARRVKKNRSPFTVAGTYVSGLGRRLTVTLGGQFLQFSELLALLLHVCRWRGVGSWLELQRQECLRAAHADDTAQGAAGESS